MERKVESEGAKVSVQTGLSEVLLEKVQQRDLIMFSRLRTSDAVSLIGINLEKNIKPRKTSFIVRLTELSPCFPPQC